MSNKRKDELLREPHGTAEAKLRKALLFKYVQLAGHDICYRCSRKIENVRDFSIEHKSAWQSAMDPRSAFFDLTNIAFSHLSCNSGSRTIFASANAEKTHCPQGHPFDGQNVSHRVRRDGYDRRECKACHRERMRRVRMGA
jgi:hypothetical protein